MTKDSAPIQNKAPRLGRLRPRDTREAASRSQAYSRWVAHLRWILPLLIIAGLTTVTLWPMIEKDTLGTIIVKHVPDLMVEHLNLTGYDTKNQAYALSANRALQAKGADQKSLIDLEKPKAEISLENGSWIAGQATYGRLNQEEKKLWLGGAVEFFHDKGYRFITDEAQIDMANKTAWGEKPVLIQGSFGEIRGTGFRLIDGGNVFIVKGHAKARLDLQRLKESDKPSPKDKQK